MPISPVLIKQYIAIGMVKQTNSETIKYMCSYYGFSLKYHSIFVVKPWLIFE